MKQAEKMIVIQTLEDKAQAQGIEFWHEPLKSKRSGWVTIPVGSHRENWPVLSWNFRLWLMNLFYTVFGYVIADVLNDLIERAHTKCLVSGSSEFDVHIRSAGSGDDNFIDIGNDVWTALKVNANGYSVVRDVPIKFRRTPGMLPLPIPVAGGDVKELLRFTSIQEKDAVLLLSYLTFAMKPDGPFPIPSFSGSHDSGKSTTMSVVRAFLDPNKVKAEVAAKTPRNLAIAATNSKLQAWDNLSMSSVTDEFSNLLCVLATGNSFRARALYTDTDEVILDYCCPVLLGSVEEIMTKGDLLDRSLPFHCLGIPKSKRLRPDDFRASFEEAQPRIFGALLRAVSIGMQNFAAAKHQDTEVDRFGFAAWGEAVEEALGFEHGAFLAAYKRMRVDIQAHTLEASPVGVVVPVYVHSLKDKHFFGTATVLYNELVAYVEGHKDLRISGKALELKHPKWPKTPSQMSAELQKIQPELRKDGIAYRHGRKKRQRWIDLQVVTAQPTQDDVAAREPVTSEERENKAVGVG